MFHLIKGFFIGFAIAVPIGPIGILCIHRTLKSGLKAGLTSGIGAALADALYASVAAFSLKIITDFLIAEKHTFRIAGSTFLIFLGIQILRQKSLKKEVAAAQDNSHLNNISSIFLLTLTNPFTFIAFLAAFASLELSRSNHNWLAPTFTTTGVFAGSALWWAILCFVAHKFKHNISANTMKTINKITAILVLSFGFSMLVFTFLNKI
jgi:threonine/homoserine/homoserine lactone efflux protein